MSIVKREINSLKPNENNPRVISEHKYEKLKNSVSELQEMLEFKPIILDIDDIILAGNQRYTASKDLGLKEVPTITFTLEIYERANKRRMEVDGLPSASYQELCDEIMFKDNVSAGDWDYDVVSNWDDEYLKKWGVYNSEEVEYEPSLNPNTNYSDVTDEQINKKAQELADQMLKETQTIETMCPECGCEYEISK